MEPNGGDDPARGPRGTLVMPDETPPPAHQAETVVPAHAAPTVRRPAGSNDPRPGERARPDPATPRSPLERAAPPHRLDKLLGAGGMGEVHAAFDPELRRNVAFKRLLPELVDNTGMSARFLTEVQVTAQLDHPNVVPVHGFEVAEDGTLGYSMKLIKGRDLSRLVEKWRGEAAGYSRAEAARRLASRLDIFLRICEAMTYAHGKGVLHRDLKPENVMVGAYNDVYVMDWGIFRMIGDPASEERVTMTPEAAEAAGHGKTVDGMVLGTPGYMSPEQANGWVSALDERSDVFTLGVILAELITLRPPRPAASLEQAVANARAGYLAPLVPLNARMTVARELRAIVARATRVDAADRYATVRELAADIRRYLRGEGVTARPDNPIQKLSRWLGRHRMVALVTILSLMVLGGGAVAWQTIARGRAERAALEQQARRQRLAIEAARWANDLDGDFGHWEVAAARLVGRVSERVSAIADGDPVPDPPPFFLAGQYDAGQVGGVQPSARYRTAISVDHAVVHVPAGHAQADYQATAARVADLVPSFRNALLSTASNVTGEPTAELLLGDGVPGLRAFATLTEHAIHVSYPGYGGYDAGYDGTKRKKYTSTMERTVDAHRVYWGETYCDRHELGLVVPVAGVLFDRTNQRRGVAGLEVSLAWVARERLTTDRGWADEVALLDATGKVIIRVARGVDQVCADGQQGGEDRDLALVEFGYDQARDAARRDEAGVFDLPDGRLAALYPLSAVDYTFVVIADPGRL